MDRVKRLSGEDRFWVAVLIGDLRVIGGYRIPLPTILRRLDDLPPRPRRTLDPEPHGGSLRHAQSRRRSNFHHCPSTTWRTCTCCREPTDSTRACSSSAALVCIVGVSELARLLGASRSTQIAASVICATIPSGVLLATSTENDYFAAAAGIGLLMILTAFSFGGRWGYRAVALGAAMGLSYMAKSTMSVLMGPAVLGLVRSRRVPAGADRRRTKRHCVSGITRFSSLRRAPSRSSVSFWSRPSNCSAPCRSDNEGPDQLADHHRWFWSQCRPRHGSQLPYRRRRRRHSTPTSARSRWAHCGHAYSVFGVSINDPHYAGILQQPYIRRGRLHAVSTHPGVRGKPVECPSGGGGPRRPGGRRGPRPQGVPFGAGAFVSVWVADSCFLYGNRQMGTVRRQVPTALASWPLSAVIAVALSIFPRWVTRLVLVGLVVSCLPQLLDNAEMPLVPPTSITVPT